MKRLLKSLAALPLLFCVAAGGSAQAQNAQIDLPLVVSDGETSQTLSFGLDPNATAGRDPALGEQIAPPLPPAGGFDTRFKDIPGVNTGLFQDYRPCEGAASCADYVGVVDDHVIGYQLGEGTQITISYDLPVGITGLIRNNFDFLPDDGVFPACVMQGSGVCTIPNDGDSPIVDEVRMIITYALGGVLPVELADFTATADGRDALLQWGTASEANNAGFHVEHFATGRFVTAGFVEGAGTTAEPQRYSYRLRDLDPGTHTFRLKQVDADGGFTYSPEVEVSINLPGPYDLSQAHPNPFSTQTQFMLVVSEAQQVRADLYDTLGRRVATLYDGALSADAARRIVVDGSDLSAGIYFIRVTGERFADTRSVILAK